MSPFTAARYGVISSLYRRDVPFDGRKPIVSFSFDDFPRTALTVGGAMLEQVGARGTYYAAAALMNSSGELGEHFTVEDLHVLLNRGHEVGNHTFSHISSRSVSGTRFCDDVEKGRQMIEKCTGKNPENFSYPFGDVTFRAKRAVGNNVTSARSIIPGFNGPSVDLNLLRANRVYGDVDQADRLRSLIRENARRKGWLIFYTHDIRLQPSAYGCTPALFEAVVCAAADGKSEILSVGQALIRLRAQSAQVCEQAPARRGPWQTIE